MNARRKTRRNANKRTKLNLQKQKSQAPSRSERNRYLDVLRGVAIALMVIDHTAFLLFEARIELWALRFWTRLSMPLFCVLMGYFLLRPGRRPYRRLLPIAVAAAAINVIYYRWYGNLEILASLGLAYATYLGLRAVGSERMFAWFVFLPFAFTLDRTSGILDYPLSVVLACVALGVVLRIHGTRWAAGAATMLIVASIFVAIPTRYVLWFALPAVALVAWGSAVSQRESPVGWIRPLEVVGRYPLTSYLVQYYVLFGLAAWRG